MNIVIALILILCGVGLVPTWQSDGVNRKRAIAYRPFGILFATALITGGVFVYLLTEGYLR